MGSVYGLPILRLPNLVVKPPRILYHRAHLTTLPDPQLMSIMYKGLVLRLGPTRV